MSEITVPILVSILSVSFAIFQGIRGNNKSAINEASEKAKEQAIINVKLDSIITDTKDIKYDMSSIKKDVQGLTERMIKVEESTKSAHHRIDVWENKED